MFQAPYPFHTYTTHITATETQTLVQHSPGSHWLVELKPNPLIHSPPLLRHRPKHIHISHNLPTPLIPHTTLIPSTSSALDTIPEPRVQPPCHALTTTSPLSSLEELKRIIHDAHAYIIIANGGGVQSDLPACGPPASFSVHLASSAITTSESVHKCRGDNVVCMWVQLKR